MSCRVTVVPVAEHELATVTAVRETARRLACVHDTGTGVVAVLPAMGETVGTLVELARSVSPDPHPRELDMLVTTGARISCALCAIALIDEGHDAVSLTGSQAGIVTDHRHGDATIVDVRADRVREELDRGVIVLVAAQQGVSPAAEVTALRSASVDDTARAIAAALGTAPGWTQGAGAGPLQRLA
jgi:aspartate kinase